MDYKTTFKKWINNSKLDQALEEELFQLSGNEEEIEERFHKDLSFGTGGLRGIIGAGSNRMNKHIVGRATQGLANYLKKIIRDSGKVCIAYDSRHFSRTFATEAALVLTANGMKVYLFEDLRPTPELSFAVRALGCDAGIVITASHNPKEYNGYKVYGNDGGQANLVMAEGIIEEINRLDVFEDVVKMSSKGAVESGLLTYIGEGIDRRYLKKVLNLCKRPEIGKELSDFKVVYTPLHGSGLMLIQKAFELLEYKNIYYVEEQCKPDGDFPTIKSPNPEEKEAFTLGIEKAISLDADILLGTDPDSDRVGVVGRRNDGSYQVFTGNQVGALLTQYLLSSMETVTKNDVVIKTIVTSELGASIAKDYGASVINTLTGFKFIGEKIKEFEQENRYKFAFGYEESYGYLAGTFVRDKDAVIASVLIVEMAAYYKSQNMSLFEALEAIYKRYGYYEESLETHTFKGIHGQEQIARAVEGFRDTQSILKLFPEIETTEDFLTGQSVTDGVKSMIQLPRANVVKLHMKDGSWIAIRPSGTEPKLKIYYSAKAESQNLAVKRIDILKGLVRQVIQENEV